MKQLYLCPKNNRSMIKYKYTCLLQITIPLLINVFIPLLRGAYCFGIYNYLSEPQVIS